MTSPLAHRLTLHVAHTERVYWQVVGTFRRVLVLPPDDTRRALDEVTASLRRALERQTGARSSPAAVELRWMLDELAEVGAIVGGVRAAAAAPHPGEVESLWVASARGLATLNKLLARLEDVEGAVRSG